jgi:hypothetical protein
MKRQRAQRLAMQWAAALADMKIPGDLRRVEPPESDKALGELRFRALLSNDERYVLPLTVRRRFPKRLAGGRMMVYVGEVLETPVSRIGSWLAQMARLFGRPLPPSREAKMPPLRSLIRQLAAFR